VQPPVNGSGSIGRPEAVRRLAAYLGMAGIADSGRIADETGRIFERIAETGSGSIAPVALREARESVERRLRRLSAEPGSERDLPAALAWFLGPVLARAPHLFADGAEVPPEVRRAAEAAEAVVRPEPWPAPMDPQPLEFPAVLRSDFWRGIGGACARAIRWTIRRG
jgi:hypothetical protein